MKKHSGVTKKVCAASFAGLSSGNVVLRRPRAREKTNFSFTVIKSVVGAEGAH